MEEVEYVDVASGPGYLAERMARKLDRPMIATDFSPRVLRRDQDLFRFLGLLDRVSLLAFDARQTPFKRWIGEDDHLEPRPKQHR